jgi:hypothetical protein
VDDQRDMARLKSVACRAASIWVDVLPTSFALTLNDTEFKCAMRHRLGLSHLPANAHEVQCDCGRHIQPGDHDHAMTCRKLAGTWTLRHDMLKGVWRRLGNRAGVATSEEPELEPLQRYGRAADEPGMGARGDILYALDSALTVADVSVVHPAAPTYRQAASRDAGAAAAHRDRSKREQYERADPQGYAFIPLSVESYGRLGKPAMELLNTLATKAGGSEEFKGCFVTNALRELSVALCKGNAVLYRRGLNMLAKKSGRHFVPGLDVPTADVP